MGSLKKNRKKRPGSGLQKHKRSIVAITAVIILLCGMVIVHGMALKKSNDAYKVQEEELQTTVANELKENLEAVKNFKGSRDEKLVVLYCKQLGINYKNLSDEEFRWLIRILKKSKKMSTPISQRKKR